MPFSKRFAAFLIALFAGALATIIAAGTVSGALAFLAFLVFASLFIGAAVWESMGTEIDYVSRYGRD